MLVVLPIGMVGPDIRYHVIGRIHTQLAQVIQLPGLARFYADTRIRVRGAVVCFVARVLAPLVASSRPLVLVLGPFFVAALYRL